MIITNQNFLKTSLAKTKSQNTSGGQNQSFIFKALIFWWKVKVSSGFENLWPVAFKKMFKKGALRLNRRFPLQWDLYFLHKKIIALKWRNDFIALAHHCKTTSRKSTKVTYWCEKYTMRKKPLFHLLIGCHIRLQKSSKNRNKSYYKLTCC